ncbi:hypothetical protein ABGB18_28155 [Nonomuraea sp. B12E4]|uniref:hypothetical protein n=1 Tax=Nonomuraea sp. B12E4 TaxID=3153564 RepID=UPI00325E3744
MEQRLSQPDAVLIAGDTTAIKEGVKPVGVARSSASLLPPWLVVPGFRAVMDDLPGGTAQAQRRLTALDVVACARRARRCAVDPRPAEHGRRRHCRPLDVGHHVGHEQQ